MIDYYIIGLFGLALGMALGGHVGYTIGHNRGTEFGAIVAETPDTDPRTNE